MDDEPTFGMTEDALRERPTVFHGELLRGRRILVTGAGRGLGKAIAALCARLGADVALCGRNGERLEASAAFLRGFGVAVHASVVSIRNPDAVAQFIDAAWRTLGPLDAVVNNAGGQFPQAALDFSRKGWNAVIDTNLNGTWWMMQEAARCWVRDARPGAIVNIVADFWRGMPGIAHTCAARAAVAYLSKTLAVEWAPHDIRVNCVAPGCVETEGFGVYPPEGVATYWEANPQRHPGDAWDVAEACVYLLASSGKFITGEVLTVDGGQQMWGDPWPTGRPDWFHRK
jgi:citronellol/citronellal dehydrogenase